MSRKAKRREPTPEEDGAQILEDASLAGIGYAKDQVDGSYFRDWVWEQMVEGEEMRKRDPDSVIPLETPSDAKKLARNMLQQLEWDTKRDMEQPTVLELSGTSDSGLERCGVDAKEVMDAFFSAFDETLKSPSIRQWLSDMILEMDEEVRGVRKSKLAEARRPTVHAAHGSHRVRDYIAVDPKGRTIAGPFTSYSDAKREAARAHGYVRFASGAREMQSTRPHRRP